MDPESLYEKDFYAWTQQQAQFLRERAWEKLDLPHLIEEMESLGRQQRQELRNRLGVLVGHLLKWEYQPQARSVSWLLTLQVQRQEVLDLLEENPSLRPYLPEAISKSYLRALQLALEETKLPRKTFPKTCPYAPEQILDSQFYPGEPSRLLEEEG
ncbi:DUF29 domain-containing protein [Synechococcus sp. 65AY6A5]|uniref:DUF29 domain-containing protein n=1 Tax=unclassified Synechococcus TaxID=2626047 RepID=UPI000C1857AF|nr:DUF29 domain-containing protein [Synechococcus sp. 65AY6A5]PIK88115.1 hypothetical protein SYN65AY6A5_02965 [Synechococcus sp. 65AY6A5]